jgi:hypothetical protein
MEIRSRLIESLVSWSSAGILSGLVHGLVKSGVPAPRNRLPQLTSLPGHGKRRRFWPGLALLVLAGWPLAGHTAGLVTAWGSNFAGETNVPPDLTNVVAVAAGYDFSLALKADGTVTAWGTNSYGQTTVPPGLSNVVAIAAGYDFSLALKADGSVVGWGDNDASQITFPAGLTNVVSIAAGNQFAMALKKNGTIAVWGEPMGSAPTNIPPNLTNVVAIAAGWYHGLALEADGTVVAGGNDTFGGAEVPSNLTEVVGVAAGFAFSLALRSDGTIVAWGSDGFGRTIVPAGLTNVVKIAAGYRFALALKADGTVAAWGENTYGQTNVPPGLTNVIAIAGGGNHSMALVGSASSPSTNAVALWQGVGRLLHGTKPIAWLTQGFDLGTFAAQILASRAGNTYLVGNSTNAVGSLIWNTAAMPDGVYQLEGLFSAGAPPITLSIFHTVLINNSVMWHSGVITANETWAAGTVHVVEGNLEIASGVTVTVQAGAIVKFASGTGITVDDGAVLDASAVSSSGPTVFTSLADDGAGGDTNLDGNNSRPEPGDWTGITTIGSGLFRQALGVVVGYDARSHGGILSTSQSWPGGRLHLVTASVVVPAGVTLTIAPGAMVKFAPRASLTVQTGGTLNCLGTSAQPITLTSLRDDTVGGDSDNDGAANPPVPGDWVGLNISGQAALSHLDIRYGGSTGSGAFASGVVIVNGGSLSLSNSTVENALYDGISVYGTGATGTVQNCVLRNLDRAIWTFGGGAVRAVNCTFDQNLVGFDQHGGGTIDAENCIVANSVQASVIEGAITIRYSDLWSSYTKSTNPGVIGQDGNISADPQFKNAAQGNYRLNYLSPCIDAANSSVAPATDALGAPRYNDPRTLTKTGSPTSGLYADMGAFEFVETASSDLDLIAAEVAGPSAVTAGQTVTVTWNDVNLGAGSAIGPWHDTLSLVPMDGSSNVVSVGEVLVGQGEVLGPGESYAASATIMVPGGVEANYQWQVHVNSHGDVFEGSNWVNNTTLAGMHTSLSVPLLTVGGAPQTNKFSAAGQTAVFKMIPARGQTVLLSLQGAFADSALELYVGEGYIPDPDHFDFDSGQFNSSLASIQLGNASGSVYYVCAHASTLGTSTEPCTLAASVPVFALGSIGQGSIANNGTVTIQVNGSLLAASDTYELVGPGGTFAATSVQVSDPTTAFVTFSLNGAATGSYTLQARDQTGTWYSLPTAVNVAPASPVQLLVQLQAPSNYRVGRPFNCSVVYRNAGNVDTPAPIIVVSGGGAGQLRLLPTDSFSTNDLELIGASLQGPAGVLRPGQTWSIPFSVLCAQDPNNSPPISLSVGYKSSDATDTVDYTWLGARVRPPSSSDDDWNALWTHFQSVAGPTWGGFVKLMSAYSTIMAQDAALGDDVGNFYAFYDVLAYALADNLGQAQTRVAGTLYLNDTNHPLAETYIFVSNADASQGGADKTDPDGTFRVLSLTSNTYTVTVPGYWLPEPVQVTVPTSGSVTGLNVIVRQGGAFSGVVRDLTGLTLLTNVFVRVVSENASVEYAATTGPDGSFMLTGLPPDTYDLTAGDSPFVPQVLEGLSVSDGQVLSTNFNLAPEATVTGQVIGSGRSLTNAVIMLTDTSSDLHTGLTDSNGSFVVTGLAADSYEVRIEAPGFVAWDSSLNLEIGQFSNLGAVALAPEATITISLDTTGLQPVTNAILGLFQNGVLLQEVPSDSNGFATFNGLTGGTYVIQDIASAFPSISNIVTVANGASITNGYTWPTLGSIVGRVTDGNAQPIEGMNVNLGAITSLRDDISFSVQTDGNGSYVLSGLPAGNYLVSVGNDGGIGGRMVTIDALLGQKTLDFVVTGSIVRGRVLAADGATPVPDANVMLALTNQLVSSATTDTNGLYVFRVLMPGRFTLAADSADGVSSNLVVDVPANTNLVVSDLTLGSFSLTGVVVDGAGQAPTNATVFLQPSSGPAAPQLFFAAVSEIGSFTIYGLVGGQYTAFIKQDGFSQLVDTITVSGNVSANFVLTPGISVTGMVMEATSGLVVSNAVVSFVDPLTHLILARSMSDGSGSFVVSDLAAAGYDLVLSEAGHQTRVYRNVIVTANPSVLVGVLAVTNTLVQGRVVAAGTNPVPNATVSLVDTNTGETLAKVTTADDGTWSTAQLPPGVCSLSVSAVGYLAPASVLVTAVAGSTVSTTTTVTAAATDDNFINTNPTDFTSFLAQAIGKTTYYATLREAPDCDTPSYMPSSQVECPDCYGHITYPAKHEFDAVISAAWGVDDACSHWHAMWDTGAQISGSSEGNFVIAAAKLATSIEGLAKDEVFKAEWGDLSDFYKELALDLQIIKVTEDGIAFVQGFMGSVSPIVQSVAKGDAQGAYNNFMKFQLGFMSQAGNGLKLANIWSKLNGGPGGPKKLPPELSVLKDLIGAIDTCAKAYNDYMASLGPLKAASVQYKGRKAAYEDALLAFFRANHCPPLPPCPPPQPSNLTHAATIRVSPSGSWDPNDKLATGFGGSSYVGLNAPVTYTILFENQPTANAPAQTVSITDSLDANLDWSTLQLSTIGFNNVTIPVRPSAQSFSATVTVTTDPNPVMVNADFNPVTGTITWVMTSIDPVTSQLVEDPLAGFLPPNTTNGSGDGYVTYTVWPRTGLPSATIITNQASIVFDVNAPILTPVATNILDVVPPSSSVNALAPSTPGPNVIVSWSGTDGSGSGIASYDIFVSADGGPWTAWLTTATNTSAVFAASIGHRYSFRSRAQDNVGNFEPAHLAADATTSVVAGAPQLTIALASTNLHFIVLSWPEGTESYHLAASADLSASAGWVAVTNAPSAVGGQLQVTLPATNQVQFFRLENP